MQSVNRVEKSLRAKHKLIRYLPTGACHHVANLEHLLLQLLLVVLTSAMHSRATRSSPNHALPCTPTARPVYTATRTHCIRAAYPMLGIHVHATPTIIYLIQKARKCSSSSTAKKPQTNTSHQSQRPPDSTARTRCHCSPADTSHLCRGPSAATLPCPCCSAGHKPPCTSRAASSPGGAWRE